MKNFPVRSAVALACLAIGPSALAAPAARANAARPAAPASEGRANYLLNAVLSSLGQIQFKARIHINSESTLPGHLDHLDAFIKMPLLRAIDFTPPAASGSASASSAPTITVGEKDLFLIGEASTSDDHAKFLTHFYFQKNEKPAPLVITLASKQVRSISLRLDEVHITATGLGEKEVKLAGDCALRQEMIEFRNGGHGGYAVDTDWAAVDCEYTVFYDKDTGKYRYDFTYDSMTPRHPAAAR